MKIIASINKKTKIKMILIIFLNIKFNYLQTKNWSKINTLSGFLVNNTNQENKSVHHS